LNNRLREQEGSRLQAMKAEEEVNAENTVYKKDLT
jgi:hypothetical protein